MLSLNTSYFLLLASAAQRLCLGAAHHPEAACESLLESFHSTEDVTVNFAQYVPAGTNLTINQDEDLETCSGRSQAVPRDLCRVAMFVRTSPISNITMEAWLPVNWTGRFLSTGNGGTNGCISYGDMAYGTSLGFASVGANNGHNGTSGEAFYQNTEVVADFAYRSVHTGVIVGKEITKAYYEKEHHKSYYLGCSTGGRQGFKSAQDFPEDFDGIVAGAPALAFNNLSSWSGHFLPITGSNTSATWLSPADWALVHEDILRQCDNRDGVEDGILEDPDLCYYRPDTLQCPSANSTGCLTSAQVQTVRQVFEPYYGVNGSLIYPRMQPGSELSAAYIYYNGQPFQYTVDWLRYAILNDTTWQADSLTPQLAAYAAEIDPYNISTWNGDLSPFQSRGGKILHYHGLADPIISSDNSPRYYEHVVTSMGMPPSELDDFYRFFRISGMGHCRGGDGAWQIGQQASAATNATNDPQHNILMRIVDWVENGNGPETVTGTKFVNDTASLGIDFQRKHCKFPLRNVCIDPQNYKKPEAWECVP
ncbi:tannase and feruloyl esterase [Hortaea werneckii]|uniref:Carboxylic ester hydrolase n=1 Tax=Hortaea werneckii TaxID=91943 RepID=A0A3M7C3Z4_HORWE|nr:tannase and feruloyl esterase [Hortaea werneckii]KAI7709226.1 tannase and feruloyl esterase [Hortaea werneckii]RMY46749.1 hypothetical protein D0865_09090 [Hortaea werneckii]